VASSIGRWREPNSLLPLRFGSYPGRYLTGLLFIIGGIVVLDGSNTYTVPFLLLGTATHVAGWLLLPSPGLRRVWVLFPCVLSQWLLLVGPQIIAVMCIPFLAWMLVRQRPLRSYPTVLIVITTGIVVANSFHDAHVEPLAYGIGAAAVVASAWLARWLATTKRVKAAGVLSPTTG
jgi:hypothetical protein